MDGTPTWFVAIGASGAQGLEDIIHLLRDIQKPCLGVVMVVLHRPNDRISFLRDILARQCGMPVRVAHDTESLVPGTCYIGEPAGHLSLLDCHTAHLVSGSGHRLRGRTVDTLFQSLAINAGPQAIGIVLSGALDDGSRGLAAIHGYGGTTMVLDPGHGTRGMQQNAIDYDGPIDLVGAMEELVYRIDFMLAGIPQSISC